jgi:hypothetical protein
MVAPLRRLHLLITDDSILPTETYHAAHQKLGDQVQIPAYWLSWRRLFRHLAKGIAQPDPCRAAWSLDICRLLKRRRLTEFEGFRTMPLILNSLPHFWAWWSQEKPTTPDFRFWSTK